MRFLDIVLKSIPIYSSDIRKQLKSNLETASAYLGYAEHFVDDGHKLVEYRQKVDHVLSVISAPDTAIKNLVSVAKIAQAVSDLRGSIHDNPQRSAKAFGKLFSGIGELARYLPFPVTLILNCLPKPKTFLKTSEFKCRPKSTFANLESATSSKTYKQIENCLCPGSLL